jgi:signal transduction histidine kinase/CheY-like chemotaxis protein/CHASE3 domain sensor protein/putative methionine-R-sulfoxide reductase with GAF domain
MIAGYGISILLLLICTIASYISIRNLLNSARYVNHTNEVSKRIEGIISALKDAETGQRGYLLTGNPSFLEHYNGAYGKGNILLHELRDLISDNEMQIRDSDSLNNIFIKRFNYLQNIINLKEKGVEITSDALIFGKNLMENAREVANRMQLRESALLKQRTENLNRFAASTPVFIIIASLTAIIITILSFVRVMKDYNERLALNNALVQKDKLTATRLNAIDTIAKEVATGNYKAKITETEKDALGNIAQSLNVMSDSLEEAFGRLKETEWQQTGIARLNDIMLGKKNIRQLLLSIMKFIGEYTHSEMAAFYLRDSEDTLKLESGIGLPQMEETIVRFGEGITGSAALQKNPVVVRALDSAALTLRFTAGEIKPSSVVAVPVYYEHKLKGVMEVSTVHPVTDSVIDFLKNAAFNIGMGIHAALDHEKLEDLLSETQAQSEELLAQHTELENINAELEAQSEKLQVSEEELRVQQEELLQANKELEERSRMLEEKNELILERNLQVQQHAETLEKTTQYKSEFLANMSHELRTPLNSILLLSRLLSENKQHNLNDEQIEYAQVIQSSGKGLLNLIDDILDLSKIEAGKMDVEDTTFSIEGVIQNLRSIFNPLATEKDLSFVISVEEATPKHIQSDKTKLEQILRNFISNALKFTKHGSIQLHINGNEQTIKFSVHDTGIGISKDKLQYVFEAFQQADGSTKRQYGGTGLGLSISKELAALLGGHIDADSTEGEGSTFTLTLPVRYSKNREANKPVDAVKPAIVEQEENPFLSSVIPKSIEDDRHSITPGDKVILIIEDDTAFATALLEYTRSKGYKGVVSVRGDEGVQLAGKIKPRGILLDIQLPIMSGWQVMDALKSDTETRAIPVHMMSSYNVKNQSLMLGAVDFINKPVVFDQLENVFQTIEKALNKGTQKVLIIEENEQHARALIDFLEQYGLNASIIKSVEEGKNHLQESKVQCLILNPEALNKNMFEILDEIKHTEAMTTLPIIIFTGKNLSQSEEMKIKKYADSIVLKTAHSYQRILDEVSLFLHLVEEHMKPVRQVHTNGGAMDILFGKTVLIADDDVRNIFSIGKLLEQYGMKIVSATDGKDAIHQLESHPETNLILMDMMMPEMDGYEAIRNIRRMSAYKSITIIAVTAKAMVGDRELCIAAGASDYITKPVDVDQLISLLRVWLYR